MQVISLGLSAAAMWWAVRMLKNAQNPISSSQRAARKRLCNLLRIAPSQLQLDEHEYQHLSKVMLPQHISVTLPDVAGSDEIVAQLREEIAFSCSVSPTSANSLLSGSKGLLLYGPPGTGKTMIASVRFSAISLY
jgi:ATP-dependent 26S proteasome regulatory subunit